MNQKKYTIAVKSVKLFVFWAITLNGQLKLKKNCFLNNPANGVNETKLAFTVTVKCGKLFVCFVC